MPQVERAWLVTAKGETVELEAGAEGAPAVAATFSPAAPNHSITTRAAASSVERRQRNMQEVRTPVQFTPVCAHRQYRRKCGTRRQY